MARSPLIFDTPVGKFYAIDMGGGLCALVIHSDDGAQSYPLDAAMCLRLQAWLAGGGKRGRPSTTDLQTVADLYQSDEAAGVKGGRVQFVADEMGITRGSANQKVQRAREAGYITAVYREATSAETD